jgi:uncharacterized protein YqjF (DUF2071 family)
MPSVTERMAATLRPPGMPLMRQRWEHLLFLHWTVPPEGLASLLPDGLRVDSFDGSAYVGLTPFSVRGLRPPFLPAPPFLSSFHEVNLRTYVHRDGRDPGVWFFSLDAASCLAVVGARLLYRLPYHWAEINVERRERRPDGAWVRYASKRFGRRRARLAIEYGPEGGIGPAEPGTLEHFLVERYILYASADGRLIQARVHHEPYPLQRARFEGLEEDLSDAAGVPGASGPLLAHYARGVDVEVFRPLAVAPVNRSS